MTGSSNIFNCEVLRNLAALTLKAYERDIEAFIAFHELSKPDLLAEDVSSDDINAFLVNQYQSKISAKSLARYRSSIKNLYSS